MMVEAIRHDPQKMYVIQTQRSCEKIRETKEEWYIPGRELDCASIERENLTLKGDDLSARIGYGFIHSD